MLLGTLDDQPQRCANRRKSLHGIATCKCALKHIESRTARQASLSHLQLFGESKEQAGKRARSANAGTSLRPPVASMEWPPRGICTMRALRSTNLVETVSSPGFSN